MSRMTDGSVSSYIPFTGSTKLMFSIKVWSGLTMGEISVTQKVLGFLMP